MMEEITPKKSIKYMEKMGVTTLTKADDNLNLALGGLDKGISPLQMAVAYSTIANDGIYIEPIFYDKVENSDGKTIVKAYQKKKRAGDSLRFSPEHWARRQSFSVSRPKEAD